MNTGSEAIRDFLGQGPYPFDIGSPEFQRSLGLYHSKNLAVLRPRVANMAQQENHAHEHGSYEFTIPFTASPLLLQDKQCLRLPKGMMLPCNPWQRHGPAEAISSADFLALQIKPDFMHAIARTLYGKETIFFDCRPFAPSAALMDLIRSFMDEHAALRTGRELMLDTLEVQIAVALLRLAPHRVRVVCESKPRGYRKNIRQAIEMMHAHFADDFSSEVLANNCGMSRDHFFKAFKIQTGKTPYAYLKDIRIEKAMILLRNPELTITQVCYRCGFSGHSHFTSLFRQKTGLTPRRYRQVCALRPVMDPKILE